MITRERLGSARIPGGDELVLWRHGRDFIIALAGNELMNTRMSGSEEALATLPIARLASRPAPHILIGGYGMGFTLRAALANLGPTATVTVAELVPEIIEWAQGPMAELAAGCLEDPRVQLQRGDVTDLIAVAQRHYDAILLDVDNGPDGLVREANDHIYSKRGLREAWNALAPGGILAVWSAYRDPAFTRRLQQAGFTVEEHPVRARSNGKGAHHTIWLAIRT